MCFYRLAYQSSASEHKNWRVRPFKTLFKTDKEELEILYSFQNSIFINKVPPSRKFRPGSPPPLLLRHWVME